MRSSSKLIDMILEELLVEVDNLKNNTSSRQIESIECIECYVKQLIRLREREQESNDKQLFSREQEKYIIKLVTDHLNQETQRAFDSLPEDIKQQYMKEKQRFKLSRR